MAEKKKETSKKEKAAKSENSGAAETAKKRGFAKLREGLVVSDKLDKTVTIATTRMVKHAMYGKYIRRTVKYYAHDEREECGVGDLVRIVETRPYSRHKRWRVREILKKAV